MHQERCRALGVVNEQDALTSLILSCRISTAPCHIEQIGEKGIYCVTYGTMRLFTHSIFSKLDTVYACHFFPTEIINQKFSVKNIFHNFASTNLYRASRSTILSTVILDAAQARIFDPRLTSCNIISIIVVVFSSSRRPMKQENIP